MHRREKDKETAEAVGVRQELVDLGASSGVIGPGFQKKFLERLKK